jgi:hypothetical protein
MPVSWTSRSRRLRRLGALASLGLLALAIACSKKTVAPAPGPRDLNVAPVAQFQVGAACTNIAVSLDATASHDPDGVIRLYEWDFDSNGSIDTSGAALAFVRHFYDAPGPHRAKLVVTDDAGAYTVVVQSFSVAAPETLYVSSTTGVPVGPGTRASPFAALSSAIEAARSQACAGVILLATGRYVETPELISHVIIRGGYDPASWTHLAGAQSEIAGRSAMAFGVHDTEVFDLRFWSGDLSEPSKSAIAFLTRNCDASLRFVRCAFVGGLPGNGSNGDGGGGGSGAPGGDGSDGWGHGGGFARRSASAGGDGGYASPTYGGGEDGHAPSCVTGGSGGAMGGGNGSPGADGAPGVNGSGLAASGSFDGFAWVPSLGTAGSSGCAGGGGGGGGGGDNCGSTNGGIGHGGGGGEGGHAGGGGAGGHGGGASIALILIDASPRFDDCTWVTNRAGDGGLGGNGGPSSPGGAGGHGSLSCVGPKGGDGGQGGTSGAGGGGQGGPGGPSWCIVKLGSSNPVLVNPTFTVGTGGAGGLGGLFGTVGPRAANGPNGPAAAIGP